MMKTMLIGRAAAWVAATGLLLGQSAMAAETAVIRTADIRLADDGLLTGTVLTPESQPVSNTTVVILHGQRAIAEVTTNAQGEFAVSGLRNGSHTVQLAGATQPVRFWSSTVAPPNASSRLVLVNSTNVVRGQECGAECGESGCGEKGCGSCLLGGGGSALVPMLVFGGVTAVVLATTLDDDDTDALLASP